MEGSEREALPSTPTSQVDTPRNAVLFIIFNRPDVTATVFEAIRKARPPRLYIAADGPRPQRPGEAEKCAQTRAVVEKIDWDCECHTLFQSENLGCRRGVTTALDWFFTAEPQGIILEDDCLPGPSFFRYCDDLLDAYRDDDRVGHIAGTNYAPTAVRGDVDASYLFSRHISVWGWATWRNRWFGSRGALNHWPEFPAARLMPTLYPDRNERRARLNANLKASKQQIDAWSYEWVFANASQSRLAIVPRVNQIINIGFGAEATHTTYRHPLAQDSADPLDFPLAAPRFVCADHVYDQHLTRKLYPGWLWSKFNSLRARLADPDYLRRTFRKLSRRRS